MTAAVVVTYPFGSLIRLVAAYTDPSAADAPVDPTTVTVKIKHPDGTVTTKDFGTDAEVVRDDVGAYHMDLECDAAGTWVFGWFSTGTGQAAGERTFKVADTAFA